MRRLFILSALIFGLFFIGGGLFFLSQTAFPMWQSWHSMQQWQPAYAQLLSVSGGENYTHAHYRYQVNGATFTGERVYVSDFNDNIGAYHSNLLNRLHNHQNSDQPVQIWVNPVYPQEAVIDRDMRWGLFALISGFCSIFILIGAVVIYSSIGNSNKESNFKRPSLSKLRTEWKQKQQDPNFKDSFVAYSQYRMAELKQAANGAAEKLDWKTRKGWESAKISSQAWKRSLILWGVAIFWNVISTPLLWAFPHELAEKNYAILIALLFPLAGIFLLYKAVMSTLEYRRFGQVLLEMDPYPGAIGGHVGGRIKVSRLAYNTATHSLQLSVRLECVYSYVSGSGKNRSRHENIKWAEQGKPQIGRLGQGVNLAFRFDVPDNLPNADVAQTGDYNFWRLSIKAEISGIDLNRQYNIPVFNTGETSRFVRHDISAQVAARKSKESDVAKTSIAMGNFDIPGLSRAMRLSTQRNEIRMTFPMFRNKALTIFAAAFAGGFGFASYSMIDMASKDSAFGLFIGLFCAPFLIIALIAAIMTIYLPFNNLRVCINADGISVLRRLLFVPIFLRSLGTKDISHLSIARSGSTGQGVDKIEHYKLKAHDKAGKSITLAEDLDGEDVAAHFCDYLAQRLNVEFRA